MVLAQNKHPSEEFMINLSIQTLIPFLIQHVLPSSLREFVGALKVYVDNQ